jgi:hypothetical protein
MANPGTRQELQKYCLRTLGDGVVQINVSKEQVEDRTDEALQYFAEFHFEGVERAFYLHQITQDDIDNTYITVPDDVLSIIQMYPVSNMATSGMFSIEYQMFLNDFFNLRNAGTMIDYVIAKQYLAVIQDLFNREKTIEYNRYMNKVFIRTEWNEIFQPGNFVLFEIYRAIDPDIYNEVYNDIWLKKYLVALIKRQWGQNMSKYGAIQMPGGTTLNGTEMYNNAQAEVEKIEEQVRTTFSYPVDFFVG